MTDRDQVAREVLTEYAADLRVKEWDGDARDVEAYRDRKYPAPAAPVTVTLGGRTYTELASRWDANELWVAKQSELGLALSRIASDARRIEVLERENARLRDEADYSDGGVGYLNAVNHGTNQAVSVLADLLDNGRPARVAFGGEKLEALAKRLEALKREPAEARRLMEDWQQAALTLGESLGRSGPVGYYTMRPAEWLAWAKAATSQGEEPECPAARERLATSQGEGHEAGVSATTCGGSGTTQPEIASSGKSSAAAPSPAPIPLDGPRKLWLNIHTTGEVYAHTSEDSARWARSPQMGWETVPVVEAVADAATVERVARAILDNDREQLGPSDWEWNVVGESVRGSYVSNARAALRALGITVQEGKA